jgi:hypothetical protein
MTDLSIDTQQPIDAGWSTYRERVLAGIEDGLVLDIEDVRLGFMCGAYHAVSLLGLAGDAELKQTIAEAISKELEQFIGMVLLEAQREKGKLQ